MIGRFGSPVGGRKEGYPEKGLSGRAQALRTSTGSQIGHDPLLSLLIWLSGVFRLRCLWPEMRLRHG